MLQFFNQTLHDDLIEAGLGKWQEMLPKQLDAVFSNREHGKTKEWLVFFAKLPDLQPSEVDLNTAKLLIGHAQDCDAETQQMLTDLLQQFHPWRKGPYSLFGIDLETEWHSDWKWQRIFSHLSPLKNRSILDVGCGNGYHMWRMRGEGARLVVGADPSQFFLMQFQIMKHYIEKGIGQQPVHLIPLKGEELPAFGGQDFKHRGFDTVFSMGVLYHRISPIHHLQELKRFLRKGGELVLETLVIEEKDENDMTVLIPEDRYAKMRNVWFIPTTPLLTRMLERAGFKNIRVVDVNQTSVEEQRKTDWMNFESLADFLDPDDSDRSLEGYPAPLRATIICEA